jgi:D-psicose/D-tagatose/L-ribulose 3-epimerase
MKVGVNMLLWTAGVGKEHYPLFESIKGWGADGVEVPIFSWDVSDWNALGEHLDNVGLERTAVAVLPQGTNLISDDPKERQAAVDFLKGCVDRCVALGAEVLAGPYYSPVGRLVGRGPTEEERKRCVEGLREVGEHAAAVDITLAFEPLNRFETYFVNTQADATRISRAVGLGNVGQMYDTFHANIEEKRIEDAIQAGGEYIRHVHISANDRGTPGEDHIDYETTFAALKRVGYDGWLVIEAFGQRLPELAAATCVWRSLAPSEEHVMREGIRFVREHWK